MAEGRSSALFLVKLVKTLKYLILLLVLRELIKSKTGMIGEKEKSTIQK